MVKKTSKQGKVSTGSESGRKAFDSPSSELRATLKNLPQKPGVYLFYNEHGEVIYVGKAKSLRSRVRSYFQQGRDKSPKTEILRQKIVKIETIIVSTELEALALEANLIKEHRPRYNVVLRDDKNFLYVRIAVQQDFPEVTFTRKLQRDGARYFGPYTSAESIRETMQLTQKLFNYRACSGEIKELEAGKVQIKKLDRRYPCMELDIKRCFGPCVGKIDKAAYRVLIERLMRFLKGDFKDVQTDLQSKMQGAVATKNFEFAARYRDQLQALSKISEKQHVVSSKFLDQDILAVAVGHKLAVLTLLQVRAGKLLGKENFTYRIDERLSTVTEILAAFLQDYYLQSAAELPAEVLLQECPEDLENLQNLIKQKTEIGLNFLQPERGEKMALIKMAGANAKQFLESRQASWEREEERTLGASEQLAEILGLEKIQRMECFDISHLQGSETVASMSVFKDGKPLKAHYRHFKVRTLIDGKIDDYAALQEVLTRRLKYLQTLELSVAYKLRKLKKKELPGLVKLLKGKGLMLGAFDYRSALVVEKKKKIVACGRIRTYASGERELSTLWVKESERGRRLGQLLIFELLKKIKKGKIYRIVLDEGLVPYYEEVGAQRIHALPPFVKQKWEHFDPAKRQDFEKRAIPLIFMAKSERHDQSFTTKPDLIVIDGGKGQLSEVVQVVKALKFKDLKVISLAKREEEIFLPDNPNPLILGKDHPALQLLQRLRDEAHRFAIEFHRKLHEKAIIPERKS